jgi:NTP pyrophosphatase (non-canonical NTP hydrolase)
MIPMEVILEMIKAERQRQDAKFPDQADGWEDTLAEKTTVLTEEYLEFIRSVNDREPGVDQVKELVQVAAVCVKMLQHWDNPATVLYLGHQQTVKQLSEMIAGWE